MTPKEYLTKVLDREYLSNDSDEIKTIWQERENVERIVSAAFPESNPTIRYGGGKAKGTMVKSNYDLDIIVYFKCDESVAGSSLEEIYNNVAKALEPGYMVERKNSALRLMAKSGVNKGIYFHIDVVPGRYTDEYCGDAFLYQNNADKCRLKTNLQVHIDKVRNSGLQDIIKLAKVWKHRAGLLMVRTFLLELLVIEVLKKADKSNMELCITSFWEKLRDNIDSISIEDPANPNGNDLSQYLDNYVKVMLKTQAQITLSNVDADRWESILGPAETMSAQEKIFGINTIRVKNPSAPEPYQNDYHEKLA